MAQLEAGLTEQQKQAIARLDELQKGNFFVGVSRETMICDFLKVNNVRKTTPEKTSKTEQALFALCGYTSGNN